MRLFRLLTFNVINVTSLTFNVLCFIAISDDEYCLERDVLRYVQLTKFLCSKLCPLNYTILIFKLQEVNKETNKEYYKLVACQIKCFMTNL